ncbi:MAG: hypothetical protein JWM98_2770 [Thermoleophilia bacterium]|nr:hypothetical protein [Thermoleophilia bacterium]
MPRIILRLGAPVHTVVVAALALVLVVGVAGTAHAETRTFAPTGSYQTYVVPAGVTGISVSAVAGAGGNGAWTPGIGGSAMALGAPGGTARVQVPVTPGEELRIFVGSGGGSASGMNRGNGGAGGDFSGGNGGIGVLSDAAGGGGGATTITRADGTVLLVVGGGGGGGGDGVNGPGFGRYVGGNGGAGGISPGAGGGGTGNGPTGAGGGGGADTNYTHGGSGGTGVGTTGAGGGGGGGRWAGHGGDAGAVVVNVGLIEQGGGGGGGGANWVAGGARAVTWGVDDQSGGANGSLQLATANPTTTTISVEDPNDQGPNDRGIVFTANVTNAGVGGTVAFTAINQTGTALTFCPAAPVSNGVATCTPTLASGGYLVKAAFSGSYTGTPSVSGTVQKDIGRATTTTFINSPPTAAGTNQAITLTVRVDGASGSGTVSWGGTGPVTNCPGTLSFNGGWVTSCTFTTVSTSPFQQAITAKYNGTATADVSQRTAASAATQPILVTRPRSVTRNTIVAGSARFPLGQSVSFTACRAYSDGPSADFCPWPAYSYMIQTRMNDASCSSAYDGNAARYIYTCRPLSVGPHVFYSEFHNSVGGEPRGECDGKLTSSATSVTCNGVWYYPSQSTTVVAYGPAHHLALAVNNPTPVVLEPFQASVAGVRDVADDVLTDSAGAVTWSFVTASGAVDASAGRCYADGRCIAVRTGELRVRARTAAGISGIATVSVNDSNSARVLTLPSSPVVHSARTEWQSVLATVDTPDEFQPIDFYIDGYAAPDLCSRTYMQNNDHSSPEGTKHAACQLLAHFNMPAPGDHELIAVYRERGQGVATARTTLHVTGPRTTVRVASVGSERIAGRSFDVEVRGADANGEDVGVVPEGVLLTIDDGTCDVYRGACSSTRAGAHLITASSGSSTAIFPVTVAPAALARITVRPSVTVRAGYAVDLGMVGYDAFNNAVPDPQSQAWLRMGGVDCPDNVCRPTGTYNGSFVVEAFPTAARLGQDEVTSSVTVVAGDPTTVQLYTPYTSTSAGNTIDVNVNALDAWGNALQRPMDVVQLTVDGGTCAPQTGSVSYTATCTLTRAGTRTITAAVPGGVTATTTVEVSAGSATQVVVHRVTEGDVVAGSVADFTVFKADAFGNELEAARREFVTWAYSPGASCYQQQLYCYFDLSGDITVRASYAGFEGTSVVHVVPGRANTAQLSAPVGALSAGSPFQVDVTAQDVLGNPARGVSSQLAATLDGGSCAMADAGAGSAKLTCRATAAGARQLSVRAVDGGSLAASPRSLTIGAGPAAVLSVAGPTQLVSGVASPPFSATAADAYGNSVVLTGAGVAFDLDGAGCAGGVCTPVAAGAHSVAAVYGDAVARVDVHVAPGAATHLVIDGPETVAAGDPAALHVTATDAADNEIGEVAATFTLDGGSTPCDPAGCRSTVAGQHTVTASFGTARATRGLVVVPGAPTRYVVGRADASTAPVAAGDTVGLVVDAYDASSNRIGAVSDGVEVTTTNGFCAGQACVATLVGTATFSAGVDGHSAGSVTVGVTAGDAERLSVAPQDVTVASGTAVTFVAKTLDAYGNVVATVTGAASATLDGAPCAGATCTSTLLGDHAVVVSYGGFTAAATMHVTVGALHHLAVGVPSQVVAGAPFALTVTGRDAAGHDLGSVSGPFTVTDGPATVPCTGAACVLTGAGDHHLLVSFGTGANTVSGTGDVHVTGAALATLELTPSVSPLVAGEPVGVRVAGADFWGNPVGDRTATALVSIDGVRCPAAGCSANDASRLHTISATDGTAAGSIQVAVVHAPLHAIVLSPRDASITADATQAYAVSGDDGRGNPVPVAASDVRLSISTGGTCTALACGSTTVGVRSVTATVGAVTDSTSLATTPGALSSLGLATATPTVAASATTGATFTATGLDAHGNARGDLTSSATFATEEGPCAANVCSSIHAGDHTVTARVGASVVGSLVFHVVPATVHHLVVTGSATLVAGVSSTYAVEGLDRFENSLGNVTGTSSFTIDDPDGGCVAATCTARRAGGRTVSASIGSATGTLPVTVGAAPLHAVAVAPKAATISADDAQSYAVTGVDAFGNGVAIASSDVALTIDGHPCAQLACGSHEPRTHDVVATVAGITDDASLTVTAGALRSLRVTTTTPTVAAGVGATFLATGLDAFSNARGDVTSVATFATDEGPCTANVCSSTHAGPHTVTARDGVDVVGTFTLDVVAAGLDHLVVGGAATQVAGADASYTAAAFDAFDNTRGSVTADATFTIDDAAGSCSAAVCVARHAGPRVVTATLGTATGTLHVAVTPSAAHHLVLAAAPTRAAGEAFGVTAREQDAFDNDIADVTASTTFTIAGAPCAAANCTRRLVGPATIAGTHAGVSGTHAGVSGTLGVDVVAAAAHTIHVASEHASIVADGRATSGLVVTLADEHGNPVVADDVRITAAPSASAPTIGAVHAVGDGTYTATLTASTTAGAWAISARDATVAGLDATAPLTQVHDAPAHASVTLTPASIVADGAATTRATVHVTDVHDNVVDDATVRVTSDGGQRISVPTSSGGGHYGATVTSTTTAGASTLRATVDGTTVTGSASLTQHAGRAATLAVALGDPTITADGHSATTVTVRLADANGNQLTAGGAANIVADLGVQVEGVAVQADGTTTATLRSALTVGTATISASRDGVSGSASLTLRVRTSAPGTQPVEHAPASAVAPPVTDPAVAGGATRGGTQLPVTDGTARVGVACPSGAIGSCSGTVQLTLVATGGGVKTTSTGAGASSSFTLAPGGSDVVSVALSPEILRQLAANPLLRVLVTVTVTDEVGTTATATSTRTLAASRFRGVLIGGAADADRTARFASVRLTCPKAAVGGCRGRVTLDALVDAALLRRLGFRSTVFGARAVTLAPGTTAVVKVRLDPLVARLLATRAAVRVRASVSSHDDVTVDRSTVRRLLLRRATVSRR